MTSESSRTESDRRRSAVLRGFGLVLLAVTFWGGSASLAKFLIVHRFDTLIISQTRTSLSFLLLILYFGLADRSVFRIRLHDLPRFALLGVVGIALTNYTYYFTATESTVATAVLVQYTAPVLVTFYTAAISREEQLTGIKVVSLLLALVGCWLAVSGGSTEGISLRGWTILTGPLSAVTFAYVMIETKHILRGYDVWTMLIYIFGAATVFWLFVNPPWAIAAKGYAAGDWGILLLFAVVSILIPHSAFTASLRHLDASTVGITGTLEPVIAIIVAYFALGESLTAIEVLGAAGVIIAVALLQIGTNRYLRQEVRTNHAH